MRISNISSVVRVNMRQCQVSVMAGLQIQRSDQEDITSLVIHRLYMYI